MTHFRWDSATSRSLPERTTDVHLESRFQIRTKNDRISGWSRHPYKHIMGYMPHSLLKTLSLYLNNFEI